jgi:hypothetical protein
VMGTAIGGSSSRGLVDRSARSGSLNRVVELAREGPTRQCGGNHGISYDDSPSGPNLAFRE